MRDLQRITTEFIEVDDRVRLVGEAQSGRTVVLWLTQRLLNRLLPQLWLWLERQPVINGDCGLPACHKDEMLAFAQQAARAQLLPQPALQPHHGSRQWLVVSIDISATPQAMSLTFKGSEPEAWARLTLAPQPMRQWLNIVYEQYRRAEWAVQTWPAWISDAAEAQSARPAAGWH